MVTMAATAIPATAIPTKSRLDPATLKYTAVKVDVSQLTSRCKCKAFVISSQTTSRDLADMVLRKLKIDIKGHVTGTCLLADKPEGGKLLLDPDEKVLASVSPKSRKAITFQLVPVDSIDPLLLLTSLKPVSHAEQDNEIIKAGNLHKTSMNGMTLPGYKKVDANCNVAVAEGFLTSTPNPDSESVASTADSGFMIHYEPCTFNERSENRRIRSKSFDLATDNGYEKLDLSGHASDSGMVMNGNGHARENCDSALEGYTFRPSPQDGFQILQSKNSAWTPFSRYASDSMLRGIGTHVIPLTNSVPDVSNIAGNGERKGVQRRRSLPKMNLSQEQLCEKKRSITDLFALKLQLYMNNTSKHSNGESKRSPPKPKEDPRQAARDEDAMSVTSQEVAEILSAASPLRPYEEMEEDLITPPLTPPIEHAHKRPPTPEHVFQPLPEGLLPIEDDPSPVTIHKHAKPTGISGVKQSPPSSRQRRGSDGSRSSKSSKSSTSPKEPNKSNRTPQKTPVRLERGVPLFALLTTHMLAPVMVRRNIQLTSPFFGVRLCDVTYAKCVRHVIRHWETSSRQFNMDSKLAECMLVAVGGIDRRSVVIVAGKLFRGDIIVEVNGKPTLQMCAKEVMDMMSRPDVASLVVARSRLNVERSQSP